MKVMKRILPLVLLIFSTVAANGQAQRVIADKIAAIVGDIQTLMAEGPAKAAERANSRRSSWVRLPYGVPLCIGFLGYLWYRFILTA